MGSEYFVEIPGSDMKNYRRHNTPAGFVIQPVHDDHEREETHQEIDTMNPAGFKQVAMVVVVYE